MFFEQPSHAPRSHTASIRGTEHNASDRRRRRAERACDMCRLKKVKCEGGLPSRKACINCVMSKYDCTFMQMSTKVQRDKAYVQNLEMRLANMELLVQKYCPNKDLSQDLLDIQHSPLTTRMSPSPAGTPTSTHGAQTPVELVDEHDIDSDEEEANARETISDYLKGLHITPSLPPLMGKSSTLMLLRTVLEYRNGDPSERQSYMAGIRPSDTIPFWESYTWESRPSGPTHHFIYPPDDLMLILVDNYFKFGNDYSPVLHRPTFERNIARSLHLCDEGFGATLLLVCALGARESDDPRVFSPNDPLGHLRGGHWFTQVQQTLNFIMFENPRLYDLQIAVLASAYATRTAKPQVTCWLAIGHGIRMVQVLGAHRKKIYAGIPPVERELLKLAFWGLVKADRTLSYYLGRPCTIQDEDFDVELPIECDEEYWTPEDPSLAFKQPEGKLSNMMFFNWGIKLNQIQSYAMRTIYSITKAKVALGHVGAQWEERTVMELDSALNQWLDLLPEPLRWNPKETDFTFLTHAAGLALGFYDLQMVVHRPFISPRHQKSTTVPSLMICTNAARSALRILDVQFMRAKEQDRQGIAAIGTMIVAGMILLLNILNAKQSGSSATLDTDVELVNKLIWMLTSLDTASQATAATCTSLVQLMHIGGLPIPKEPDSPYKRNAHFQEAYSSGEWLAPRVPAYQPEPGPTDHPSFDNHTLPMEPAIGSAPWGTSSYPTNAFDSGIGNTPLPQSSNTVADLLRTLEDLSARSATAPASQPGPAPYDWSGGAGEEGGMSNFGFQWEEWGNLFVSAFGAGDVGADEGGGGNGQATDGRHYHV